MEDYTELNKYNEYIESGEYYKEAMDWYNSKFLVPFAERSLLIIMCGIIILTVFGVVLNIYNMLPLKHSVKYGLYLEDVFNYSPKIVNNIIGQQRLAPFERIAAILAENYVSTRESYQYTELKDHIRYVKNMSSKQVFEDFYKILDLKNKDSILLKYKKNLIRNIQIIDTQVSYTGIKIKFNAHITDLNDNTNHDIGKETLIADITYDMDKLDLSSETGTKFNFTVTNYQVNNIK